VGVSVNLLCSRGVQMEVGLVVVRAKTSIVVCSSAS
jgi:hypothetical protein